MTGLMVAERALSFVSTLILARLLIPEDFGVVAMCMSIVAALELFTAFGFDVYLIQNQKADQDHYNTAWTLKIIVGTMIAGAIVLSAQPTAAFYDETRVIWPMYVIALGSFLRNFENIGVVDCVMHPTDPDTLYAATFDKVRKPYTYNLGGPGSRIYKTTDGGRNWTKLGGGLPEGMLDLPVDFDTLTEAGSILGTPAYMAPEQFESGPIDSRTDQFAFCVALWEAIHGQRPYPGTSPMEIWEALRNAELRAPSDRSVPPGQGRFFVARQGLAVFHFVPIRLCR